MRAVPVVVGALSVAISAGCTCTERVASDPEEDRDIPAVCEAYCTELMECVYDSFEGTVEFSDKAGCLSNCIEDPLWDHACGQRQYDVFDCFVQYECPEFATFWFDDPDDTPCWSEMSAYSSCFPSAED